MKRCYSITLNTHDVANTKAFYADLLGLTVLDERIGQSVVIDLLGLTVTFESMYKKPDSYAEFYIETDDVPHKCMRLRMAGYNIPREWHNKAELHDPDGRKVIITETVRL